MEDRTEEAQALDVAARVVSNLLLGPPGDDLRAMFTDADAAQEWPLQDEEAMQALRDVAAAAPDSEDMLRRDHFRLFVGPGRGFACPYESVYTSRDQLVFGDETLDVRATYARIGLEAPGGGSEPDDHLGFEIAYIAEVAHRIVHAADDEQTQHRLRSELGRFLVDHVNRYADQVMASVAERAETAAYRALPALTHSVIEASHALAVRHLPIER